MPKMADKSFLLIDINEFVEVNKNKKNKTVKNVFPPIVHSEKYTEYNYGSIENYFEEIPSEFRKVILYGSFESKSIVYEFFTGIPFSITKYKDEEKNMLKGRHMNDKTQRLEFFSAASPIDLNHLEHIEKYIVKLKENNIYDKYIQSINSLFNIEYKKNDSLVKKLKAR